METIRVIIVDDHTLFSNGLRLLLDGYQNIKVVAEAASGKEFLLQLNKPELMPDVVLMDINMPEMNGIEATQKALETNPCLKMIALSMYGDEEYYYKMIDAGAKGFILKDSEITEVVKAIQSVYAGGTFFSQDLLYNVVRNMKSVTKSQHQVAQVSDRELEVLEQICRGLNNQEIADLLFISKRTVDKHRASLLSKTNSKNTANLVMYAIENKLVNL